MEGKNGINIFANCSGSDQDKQGRLQRLNRIRQKARSGKTPSFRGADAALLGKRNRLGELPVGIYKSGTGPGNILLCYASYDCFSS